MKLKPINVKNFAYGTVRISAASTQGTGSGESSSLSTETKVAWHVYGFSKSAEDESSSFCIYLPPTSLMFNNKEVLVDPIVGKRGGNDFYDIGKTKGNIICSIYKDGLSYKAKIDVQPVQGSILSFLVCTIGGTEKGISVQQFASGLVTLYSESKVKSVTGPFSPIYEDDSDSDDSGSPRVIGFENCYWMNSGELRSLPDQESPGDDGFIALKAGATPTTAGTASLIIKSTLAELKEEMQNFSYYFMPLYKMEYGDIAVDLRSIPQAMVAEVMT